MKQQCLICNAFESFSNGNAHKCISFMWMTAKFYGCLGGEGLAITHFSRGNAEIFHLEYIKKTTSNNNKTSTYNFKIRHT